MRRSRVIMTAHLPESCECLAPVHSGAGAILEQDDVTGLTGLNRIDYILTARPLHRRLGRRPPRGPPGLARRARAPAGREVRPPSIDRVLRSRRGAGPAGKSPM